MKREFVEHLYHLHQNCPNCPSPRVVATFFDDLLASLFPEYSMNAFSSLEELQLHLETLRLELDKLLTRNPMGKQVDLVNTSKDFFDEIPDIHRKILLDVAAMYEGDPAAKSENEVIRTYPGFYAISAYRMAHALHKMGVKVLPRMITEHAHSKTGIDIHPAAVIGEHFCIDHGTGVVIGETAIIGDHVKIYQGVTLGALSVDKKDAETKRHPSIEDHVIIYAGANILGGETVVGHHSIIGGNVWLTKSVKPHSKIYYQAKMYNPNTDETDLYIYKENIS